MNTTQIIPFDLSAGIEIMFIYLDIIDYQHVGHSKAPLLRILDTKKRLKNGNIGIVEPSHRIVFSNLDYKKLLTKSIQCIAVQLRSETGNFPVCRDRINYSDLTL